MQIPPPPDQPQPPGGEPPAWPQTPAPGIPSLLPRQPSRMPIVLAALGIVIVIALGVLALLLLRGTPVSLGTRASHTPVPGATQTLRGTVTVPFDCTGARLGVEIFDSSGHRLGAGPVTVTSPGSGAKTCTGTFSFSMKTASSYMTTLFIERTTGLSALAGPEPAGSELAAEGYRLDLTPTSLGVGPDDLKVRADLAAALKLARSYAAKNKTFTGLSTTVMKKLDPGATFNTSGTAQEGQISIRDVTATTVVFAERSPSGRSFCIGQSTATPKIYATGDIDAKTYQECLAWLPAGTSQTLPSKAPPSGTTAI